jgi:hypothetical protein
VDIKLGLTLGEEHRLKVLKNKVVKMVPKPKNKEVT